MAPRLRAVLKSDEFAATHDERGLHAAVDFGRSTADVTASMALIAVEKKEKRRPKRSTVVLTIGHSTRTLDEFIALAPSARGNAGGRCADDSALATQSAVQ